MKASIVSASLFAAAVSAHGNITSPPARQAGAAMAAVCGQAAVDTINTDPTIPLEDVTAGSAQCDLGLCRGAQFEDNANQVQQFTPGQVVNMEAILPIPHGGPMNTSIVDTATNTVVGDPLISFDGVSDVYADENLATLPANNTAFSVTMPTNLAAGQCAQAGECVLQWFWFGTNAQQTYESCVDFVMVQGGQAAAGAGAATAAGAATGAGAAKAAGAVKGTGAAKGTGAVKGASAQQ